jgi:hypothetical protein
MVMTAVVAEATERGLAANSAPGKLDFWGDLASTVDRAGGDPERIWIDDSKAILNGGKGRDRLELACLAAVHAAKAELPGCVGDLLVALEAGSLDDVELSRWADDCADDLLAWPDSSTRARLDGLLARRPLDPRCGRWRIVAVFSVVVGPAQFNDGLARHGSKASVHFDAFDRLLKRVWQQAGDGRPTFVTGDKHGGRHYYFPKLSEAFPDAWIDRGLEGPELSHYTLRQNKNRLELALLPRADQADGLVALASIVSKAVRERWMDVFNAFWCQRINGLKRTAGYPSDAARFRLAIEQLALADGHDPACWWRMK